MFSNFFSKSPNIANITMFAHSQHYRLCITSTLLYLTGSIYSIILSWNPYMHKKENVKFLFYVKNLEFRVNENLISKRNQCV